MLQIINISRARSNLSSLVKQVAQTKKPVVIVQNSIPSVVLYPYTETIDQSTYAKKLLTITGGWISPKEQKKIRAEIENRLKKNDEKLSS